MNENDRDLLHRLAALPAPVDDSGAPAADQDAWKEFWGKQREIADRRSRQEPQTLSTSAGASKKEYVAVGSNASDSSLDRVVESENALSSAVSLPTDPSGSAEMGVFPFMSQDEATKHSQSHNETQQRSLLSRLQDSHDASGERLFSTVFSRLVVGYARKHRFDQRSDNVLIQQVAREIASHTHELQADQSFREWLFAIVRREMVRIDGGRLQLPPLEDELAEWKYDYKCCVLAWAGSNLRETVDASAWRQFWRVEVEKASLEDVARQANTTPRNIENVVKLVRRLVKTYFDQNLWLPR